MRHVVEHILQNGHNTDRISTACGQVFNTEGHVERGAQLDAEGPNQWCPKCLAHVQGREEDTALHPDLGVTESDDELGVLESDGEMGDLVEEYPDDSGPAGSAEG